MPISLTLRKFLLASSFRFTYHEESEDQRWRAGFDEWVDVWEDGLGQGVLI